MQGATHSHSDFVDKANWRWCRCFSRTQLLRQQYQHTTHSAMGEKSLSTTETPGASPSVPRLPCTPNNEHKALAAAQDKIEQHRCNQDWRARARNTFGVDRVLVPARSLRKVCVSSEKRPPVSPATTTSLARPLPPGRRSKQHRPHQAAPVWLTICTEWRNGGWRRSPTEPRERQGAPRQSPLWSTAPMGRSRLRKNTLVDTLAPASRQMRATADSNAKPRLPRTPTFEQLAR